MKEAKDVRISVRITPELKQRIRAVVNRTGIAETDIVVQCLNAYVEYVEKHGEIAFPLALLPKSKVSKSRR